MNWNRAQAVGFLEVVLRHDVEATFEIVDTDKDGGHAIRVTWAYKDENKVDQVGNKVYRLPSGGGVIELGEPSGG